MRDAFIATLSELAKKDKKIILITADLGFGVFNKYREELPKQFLNVGVAEQNMTGVATGMALEGYTVFTYSIANFPTLRCLEQIRNDAAYHGANVKVVAIGGGFSYGALGMSHHATEDLAIMRAIPEVTVVSPGCIWETQRATEALVNTPGTCYLRLDKSNAGDTSLPGEVFQIGKARRLKEGKDLTIVTTGGILCEVLAAFDRLQKEHQINCRVVNVHSLKPFDEEEILSAASETGGIVTVEEHVVEGGLGGLVAEICLENGQPPRLFHRIGLRGGFASKVGSQEYLRKHYDMSEDAIVNAVLRLVSQRRPLDSSQELKVTTLH